jgi:hypothetical protein
MALAFSIVFLFLSGGLVVLAIYQFFQSIVSPGQGMNGSEWIISAFVRSINTLVISLAIFELGLGVSQEHILSEDEGNLYHAVRRTITRFVGTVCIALVLEALIMVIKYSQLDLAGNLYYPVGILFGGSTLLIALGLFLNFTKGHTE